MNILSITDLTKAYGPRTILDGVSLGLDQGDRVGLIGDNGTGKSTLLRIIIGEEPPDGGVMALRGGTRVGFLAQVPILPAKDTVRAHLSELFAEVPRAIERYEAAATAMDPEADRWFNEIERLGGWDWSYRVEQVASLLNVASFLERPLGTLSGGQKKRVALARLILSAPDLILMDEPTNHLDADTVEWLEQSIAASPATFIIVTHDRYFLENAVTRMAELRDAQLRIYDGAYSDYLTARAEDEALRERTAKRRQNILKEELEWARRSPQARTTKSRSRLDRVDALAEDVERLTATRRLSDFTAGSAPRLGKTVLELVHVTKGYEETGVLVDDLTLMLRKGDRYGVIGANGSGKTTLMRLVLGELLPDAGTVKPGTQTQFAYFDQHRALLLDLDKTVKETVCQDGDKVFPGGRPQHYASWLERFAFGSEQHRQKVERLSGGERNRLALARFLLEEANFLVLDEPTNDLDLMTMHVLEEALLAFEGCVLVVSHDRYFLDRVATGVIAFERDGADGAPGGRPLVVQGDYTTYKRLRAQNERARVEVARADVAAGKAADKAARAAATAPAEPKRATGGAKRGLSWAETRELAAIEPAIEAHEGRLAELEAGLADPALWQDGGERGLALERDRAELKATIDAAYARWAALTEKRDG